MAAAPACAAELADAPLDGACPAFAAFTTDAARPEGDFAAFESLPEVTQLLVANFLQPRDLLALALTSTRCAAAALDEATWKRLTLAAFPARGAAEPPDHLWRAEYRWQRDVARAARAYMRALSQGAAGCRKGAGPARLASPWRFAAMDGNSLRATRDAARAAAAAAAAAPRGAAATAGGAHLAALDAAASLPHVPARQGKCAWTQLGGLGSGATNP